MASCIYAPIREAVYSLRPSPEIKKVVEYAFCNEKDDVSKSRRASIEDYSSWIGCGSWGSGTCGKNSIIYRPACPFFCFIPVIFGDGGSAKGCEIFILVLLVIQLALVALSIFISLFSSLIKFGKEINFLSSLKKRLHQNLNTNETTAERLIHSSKLEKLTKKSFKIVKLQKSLAIANLITTLQFLMGIIILIGVTIALLTTTNPAAPTLAHIICLGVGGGSICLGLVMGGISFFNHRKTKPRLVKKAVAIVESLTQVRNRIEEDSKINNNFQYCCKHHQRFLES